MGNPVKNMIKLLYVLEEIKSKTDENHRITTAEIIGCLERNGMSADRVSIYDYIATLNHCGTDIVFSKEKPAGYFMASRLFELAELKLLVDAVQSSKFITFSKSRVLVEKLMKLTSDHEAMQLNRFVYIMNRVKTPNEEILYNVDMIHSAIQRNRQIRFVYYRWTADKQLKARNKGNPFMISPWALTWDDENYYLIAYDSRAEMVKHYRVDKMRNMEICEGTRLGKDKFTEFSLPAFSRMTFGMFGGERKKVTLRCREKLVGAIIDRFGTDAVIVNTGDGWFEVKQEITVSEQFFGWIFGLGSDVVIAGPESVAEDFRRMIGRIADHYDTEKLKGNPWRVTRQKRGKTAEPERHFDQQNI